MLNRMRLLQASILKLRIGGVKTSSALKTALTTVSEGKALPVNNPRTPKPLSKTIKIFKRKAARQDHSSFCYALRQLGLFQAWKRRHLNRTRELSKITMCYHVLNYLGCQTEIVRLKSRLQSCLNLFKKRLKFINGKPDFVHLQKIYRAALNKVFSSLLGRCRIVNDSAIIGTVLKTKYHALKPGYTPKLWGLDFKNLTNALHWWVRE